MLVCTCQTLSFLHGQLYVALSRVKSIDGLKVLIIDKDKKPTNTTTNVVYVEAFQNVRAKQHTTIS